MQLAESLGLSKRGSGQELRANCPIHGGRDAFSLNLENGVWNCFSACGGGEFSRLVQLVLNVTTREAERWIATNGQAVDALTLSKQLHDSLVGEAEPEVPAWYQHYQALDAQTMPVEFLDRGFTWETINEWGIRYDPTSQQVVIPYLDHQGTPIGTVARNMVRQPKYLNSPGLPKSLSLFGYYKLQQGFAAITLVEGPLDAIWLQAYGYRGVALLGLSLSPPQVRLLQRAASHIVVGFDADRAGTQEVAATIDKLERAGWTRGQLLRLRYPEGRKDAQECSPQELREAYASLQPYQED